PQEVLAGAEQTHRTLPRGNSRALGLSSPSAGRGSPSRRPGPGSPGEDLADRVDTTVEIVFADHQGWGDTQGGAVRRFAQHPARCPREACLPPGRAARVDVPTRPQPTAAECGRAVAEELRQSAVQVPAERGGTFAYFPRSQHADHFATHRAGQRVPAEGGAV